MGDLLWKAARGQFGLGPVTGFLETIDLFVSLEKLNGACAVLAQSANLSLLCLPLSPFLAQQFLSSVLGLLSKELNYCFY